MRRIILSLALVGAGLALAPASAQAQFVSPLYQQRVAERQVVTWFQAYLGRLPTAPELATLTNQYLLSGNALYTQSILLGCNEFYARSGGTPQSYLNAVFIKTLGRRPTYQEISALQGPLVFNGRLWFAQAFLATVGQGWQLNAWNAAIQNAVVQPVVVPVIIR
jgi:hypothetical protein